MDVPWGFTDALFGRMVGLLDELIACAIANTGSSDQLTCLDPAGLGTGRDDRKLADGEVGGSNAVIGSSASMWSW